MWTPNREQRKRLKDKLKGKKTQTAEGEFTSSEGTSTLTSSGTSEDLVSGEYTSSDSESDSEKSIGECCSSDDDEELINVGDNASEKSLRSNGSRGKGKWETFTIHMRDSFTLNEKDPHGGCTMQVSNHYGKAPWKALKDSHISENSVLGPVEMTYLKTNLPATWLYSVNVDGVESERLRKKHVDSQVGAVSGVLYAGEKITPDKPKVLISTPKTVAETFLSKFSDFSMKKIRDGAGVDAEYPQGYRIHESNPIVHSIEADMRLLHQKEVNENKTKKPFSLDRYLESSGKGHWIVHHEDFDDHYQRIAENSSENITMGQWYKGFSVGFKRAFGDKKSSTRATSTGGSMTAVTELMDNVPESRKKKITDDTIYNLLAEYRVSAWVPSSI
jgi:hypothetical protein